MPFTLSPGPIHEPMTGRSLSAQECLTQVSARRDVLQTTGMKRGDRAFIAHGNCIDFFLDLLAVWSLGGAAVPLDPQLTGFELRNLLAAAKPRLFLHRDDLDSEIRAVVEDEGVELVATGPAGADAGDLPALQSEVLLAELHAAEGEALILFTSGSTGQPKGVVHTHESLRAKWQTLSVELSPDTFRRTLCVLPTHFGHGLICNALFPWLSQKDLFVLPAFSPQVIMSLGQVLTRNEITFMSSVPAIWQLALRMPRPKTPKLIEVFCGSAPLSSSLWNQIADWCGSATVRNLYGITETGSWIGASSAGDTAIDGMVGRPLGGSFAITQGSAPEHSPGLVEAKATDVVGHVWIKTPAIMQGYLDRPDLTAQAISAGWFSTGDIGLVDTQGRLVLKGRERDEINRGGLKIYPVDIEAAASSFPSVRDTCSFACEDPRYGPSVGIALVMDQANPETLRDLHGWLSDRLADKKIPTIWYVLEHIPKTNRGKVNRAELARHCAAQEPLDMAKILETAT